MRQRPLFDLAAQLSAFGFATGLLFGGPPPLSAFVLAKAVERRILDSEGAGAWVEDSIWKKLYYAGRAAEEAANLSALLPVLKGVARANLIITASATTYIIWLYRLCLQGCRERGRVGPLLGPAWRTLTGGLF
jgi:hypothetical protein